MSSSPPPTSPKVLRAGWIMARAFARSRVQSVFTFPWALLAVLPGAVRGGLFLDRTRTGMVLLYRSNLMLDILVVAPLAYVGSLVYLVVVVLLSSIGPVPTMVFLAAIPALLLGLLPLLPRRGSSLKPTGPETPPGERWELAGLAQLPGTRFTAIQTAMRAVRAVPPPGAVIVATANSDELLRQYQRFGFTAGPGRRVHLVVADEDAVAPVTN